MKETSINLEEYKISYEITILPHVIYSQLVSANNPLEFKELYIPPELENKAIECRFVLFSPKGECIELSNNIVLKNNLKYTLNIVPLKIIQKLVNN